MAGDTQDVGRQIIMRRYAQTSRNDSRQKAVHDMHQNSEDAKVARQELDVVRAKVFNSYGGQKQSKNRNV